MLTFLLVNLSLLALFFAPLVAALCLGWLSVQEWYENLLGDLFTGFRNNRWAKALIAILVVLLVEWSIAGNGAPIRSPLVSSVSSVSASAGDKAVEKGLTDGQAVKRFFTLLAGGTPPPTQTKEQYLAQQKAEQAKADAKKVEETRQYSSWIWAIAAMIAMPTWALCMLIIFSDDVFVWFVGLLSMFKKKSATVSSERQAAPPVAEATTEGGTPSGEKKSKWPKWLSPSWWLEYMSDDILSDVGVEFLKGRLGRFFSK